MSFYILDTDHASLLQRNHPSVVGRVLATPDDSLALTIVTAEEQLRGWLSSIRRASRGAPHSGLRPTLRCSGSFPDRRDRGFQSSGPGAIRGAAAAEGPNRDQGPSHRSDYPVEEQRPRDTERSGFLVSTGLGFRGLVERLGPYSTEGGTQEGEACRAGRGEPRHWEQQTEPLELASRPNSSDNV